MPDLNSRTDRRSAAWAGTVIELLDAPEINLMRDLRNHHQITMNEPTGKSQETAWQEELGILRDALAIASSQRAAIKNWAIVLEYVLPRERGRRPDVVLLTGNEVVALEFKGFHEPLQAHLDQSAAYARDLAHYHAASHELAVIAALVCTRRRLPSYRSEDVSVIAGTELSNFLLSLSGDGMSSDSALEWIHSEYEPLPSLVSAARRVFEHEPLPSIRRALSAGVPETVDALLAIARTAKDRGERHLVLVAGVPGAGKTLVGLQFVYANHFGESDGARPAVFLSGNGPLVQVLQHALRSTVFVQDVHGFLHRYGGDALALPREHMWVYDEAQRAWDAERVSGKRGHGISEPADFLSIGARIDSWAVMIGLIGEGQEIHLGEESGIVQWADAVAESSARWHVHCPPRLAETFSAFGPLVHEEKKLDLTVSLRAHLAEDVQDWIAALIDGQIEAASALSQQIRSQGFVMYVTRDLGEAQSYARERYSGAFDSRYGLLASSRAKNLPAYGVHNEWSYTRRLRVGPWYNATPDDPQSCCSFRDVATEFSCQGLELDLPIIAWGDDLRWVGDHWESTPSPRSRARDPHQLRLNSYRVLLSRGRDGFVLFVPPETALDASFETLQRAGVRPLEK